MRRNKWLILAVSLVLCLSGCGAEVQNSEKQQQLKISLLKPENESILEHTISYEQLAVDLTAELAKREQDLVANKKAFDADVQKIKAELPNPIMLNKVWISDAETGRTLYHRIGAPCIKNGREILLYTAEELKLRPCHRCKPTSTMKINWRD